MLKQFNNIKQKHPDKIILFRMGDFYETFFEDAEKAAKILGITLTARNKKDENPIPLAGFPYHSLKTYLEKLIRSGEKVVICEQLEDPKKAVGLVKRDIVEIITPGAIIDENMIDVKEHNYLTAIYIPEKNPRIGLSCLDISTGDFIYTEFLPNQLKNEILRVRPKEIIVKDEETANQIRQLKLEISPLITVFDSYYFEPAEAKEILKKQFSTITLEGFGSSAKSPGLTAAGAALAYVRSLKSDDLKHINSLRYYSLDNYMQIDEISRHNLELLKSIRYATRQGSLISVIDQTMTAMGSRLLTDWLLRPLLDIQEIEKRLDAVQEFKENIIQTEEIRGLLKNIGDLSRLLSKIGTLRINPREMVALKNYLESSIQLKNILHDFSCPYIAAIREGIEDYSSVIDLIENSIVDLPPILITGGGIIQDGINPELDELRSMSREGKGWIARLEDSEKKKTGIPSLKVGYNKVFGYYLEVTNTHKNKVPEYYICKQTLVNCERYISPQLKEYEAKVLGAEERIKSLEYELFQEIREKLLFQLPLIQQYVDIISQLDTLTSLAYLAHYNNYIRPRFNQEGILELKECRHPVIEKLLTEEKFIPNDVSLDDKEFKIILITGPNMAGKSTYLRQVGLLAIMAQMGSFIPATSANLPIFDKIFTRVGASDNLAMGQSTFLVEMIETANILNTATPQSLILLDEIGRGTSTFDGLSLAWAIVEFIATQKRINAKTLFATHYHELTDLEEILPGVKNFNIAVKEWNEEMIFIRRIERGGADKSYGIQVAKLAGIPDKVIKRAKQILHNLEEQELSPQGLTATVKRQLKRDTGQIDIFEILINQTDKNEALLEELKNADLNNMTPLEAHKFLQDLQEKLDN
ncbi:MAG: DNA mismatch repair protein MutS [Candidatus Cloacimonetes bacterium]|nr:DNA mismatch repair protein MutS [Candidatus Cloacimonadota bacterium]